ncbi:hypothetical protein NC99_27190 [Sunxiuqinia dokdonensis]|uniref:Uncharacterized protein n=1 Tax=Sunxiuqinia dokdonensis TaxID=1409788 RepID=A0A0L8V7R5_9BACT|nr:hypothetical protein NC99_27190 [Sunxiuqinia dokdonensis]
MFLAAAMRLHRVLLRFASTLLINPTTRKDVRGSGGKDSRWS